MPLVVLMMLKFFGKKTVQASGRKVIFQKKSAGRGEGARTKAGYVAESVPAELEVDSPVLTDSPITTSLVHTRESMPAFHVPYVETTATVPS
jgi:hypothetical protein